jgi:uncharacterized protein (DUF58 family)
MLSASEIQMLERFVLGGRLSSSPGSSPGLRRARLPGAGLEFHEYRPYQPGDDPRSIDWTVEARLRQLVVRVSRIDANARLHVLVDVSASMGIGTPQKLACATRLAAALSYVAIERRDTARVSTFNDAITRHVRPAGGRSQIRRVFSALGRADASGASAIDATLVAYSAAVRGPGLVVILSDFFEAGSRLEGARALLHRGLTPALVQIVAPEEIDPQLSGPTLLFDVEDDTASPLVVDEAAVAAFRARMKDHSESLRAFCLAQGLPWMRVVSSATFTELVSAAERAGLFTHSG